MNHKTVLTFPDGVDIKASAKGIISSLIRERYARACAHTHPYLII